MEKQIIAKLGNNTTGKGKTANSDIQFAEVELSDGSKASSLYTYKGGIYILDNEGNDIAFSDYNEEDQKKLYEAIVG